MGQGHIRKGFFFYFGLFVLLLIAIFCICLVVMMFNPGKTVLWMQYFTANQHYVVEKTSDGMYDINMNFLQNDVDTIEINCTSYANVIVQRDEDDDFAKEGIHVINRAKGFQGASGAVHFDCKVSYNNRVLTIDVSEPNGFLHFSKDIKIVLASYTEYTSNFSNINLIVNTVDGDFSIGNVGINPKEEDVKLKSLTVDASGSGDIVVGEYFATNNLEKLSLKTSSGDISSLKSNTYQNKEYKGIQTNCDIELGTVSGEIELDLINAGTNNLKISNEKGNIGANMIKAENVDVVCKHGNYIFGTVDSNLNFAGANADTMITPNIIVDYIAGNFVVSGSEKAEPDVKIKKIEGEIRVLADKGKIDVDEAKGLIEIQSGNNFSTDIIVSEQNNNKISVSSKYGDVRLGFLQNVSNVTVRTETGKIYLNVTSSASFTANAKKNAFNVADENQEVLSNDNIFVSIELLETNTKNPLVVNGGTGLVNIFTNASVDYKLVAKTSLAV